MCIQINQSNRNTGDCEEDVFMVVSHGVRDDASVESGIALLDIDDGQLGVVLAQRKSVGRLNEVHNYQLSSVGVLATLNHIRHEFVPKDEIRLAKYVAEQHKAVTQHSSRNFDVIQSYYRIQVTQTYN